MFFRGHLLIKSFQEYALAESVAKKAHWMLLPRSSIRPKKRWCQKLRECLQILVLSIKNQNLEFSDLGAPFLEKGQTFIEPVCSGSLGLLMGPFGLAIQFPTVFSGHYNHLYSISFDPEMIKIDWAVVSVGPSIGERKANIPTVLYMDVCDAPILSKKC